jgi:hypothetical protein
MPIPEDRLARNMDLKKSMLMGIDECHIALRESYADLSDEAFRRFPLEHHNNIATIVMHCLQQHDDFNGNLQHKRGLKARHEWHFLKHEERFGLWGLPEEKLPKPGDQFPSLAEAIRQHEEIHANIIRNISALSEEDFTSSGVGPWPRLCDIFFRAIYHTNSHIRQIWFLRGVMGIESAWPTQHYA